MTSVACDTIDLVNWSRLVVVSAYLGLVAFWGFIVWAVLEAW